VGGVLLLILAAFFIRDWHTAKLSEKRTVTPVLPNTDGHSNGIPDARDQFATWDEAIQSKSNNCPRITRAGVRENAPSPLSC